MNTVGKPGQLGGSTFVASSPSRCSPKVGMPTRSRTSSASAPSARNSCASRSSAARSVASPTISMKKVSSMSSMPMSSAFPSTSPPSQSSHRRSRRVRPFRSRPCGPNATRSKSAFPRVEGYRVELPEERLDGRVQRRLDSGAHARPGRRHRHAQLRHHRRSAWT